MAELVTPTASTASTSSPPRSATKHARARCDRRAERRAASGTGARVRSTGGSGHRIPALRGWGRDFHAGEVSRQHGDIDLVVWREDREEIEELLAPAGWLHAPERDEDGGTGSELGRVRLELTFLVSDEEGRPCIDLKGGPARWPDQLGDDVRELHGVRARVLSRGSL